MYLYDIVTIYVFTTSYIRLTILLHVVTRCCPVVSNDRGLPPNAWAYGRSLSFSVNFCFGLAISEPGWERRSFVLTNAEKWLLSRDTLVASRPINHADPLLGCHYTVIET